MLVYPFRLPDEGGTGLTIGNCYEVLGIEADYYRIHKDPTSLYFPCCPSLYEPGIFEIIDPKEPSFRINLVAETGERYAYPQNWLSTGFFEDYFNDTETVVEQFWRELKRYYNLEKRSFLTFSFVAFTLFF